MQVILKKDIPQVGRIGEIVKVKDGYARNFLIPRSMAIAANPANLRFFEHQKKLVEFHKKKIRKESEASATKMKGIEVTISRRVNESGKLFGTLTNAEIAHEIEKLGHKVDRRDVELEAIKTAGSFTIKLRLPGDVFVDVALHVKGIEEKVKEKKAKVSKEKAKKAKDSDEENSGEEKSATDKEEVDSTEASE